MAAYATPVGLVTFTPAEELAAELASATERRAFRAKVHTHDLRQILRQHEDMLDYIRRSASAEPEAHELLKRIAPREA